MSSQSIIIPDIGDFDAVDVIEVLVKEGDTVSVDDSLIVLESDKASMEVPATVAGKITALTVKVGDKVSTGDSIGTIESNDSSSEQEKSQTEPKASEPKSETSTPKSVATQLTTTSAPDGAVDLVVLGAGPGGYSAAFRAADLGLNVTLIERYSTLGGVCLNVGCIPSKALLHVTEVMEEAASLAKAGVSFAEPKVDLDALRSHKESVIKKLTGGLAGMAKSRKVTVIQGTAQFSGSHELTVKTADGEKKVTFKQCIIAAGSESVKLPFMPEDPRVIDSTGALKLQDVPERMLVIGGGIIGLEMATVYHALGSKIDVVEMLDGLMAGADKDLVKVWQKRNPNLFETVMTETKTVGAEAKDDGIYVSFEGKNAPKEAQRYDRVLVAVGRRPNGKSLNIEAASVQVDERGFIPVDKQMRTNQAHIFAIGDIVGQPMLAHKAVHEAHVAAEVAAGHKAYFDARVIPGVAYTSPEVAWVGVTEAQAKNDNLSIEKAIFPWAASGRAIANGCEDGFTKLIVDKETGRVIGGGIVGPNAGDMIGEIALAIEMNAVPADIALTIHPHPTLGESIGLVAEVYEGSCTDLPPQRKK
ncbi:dihydrolipoyl dehydrogenase [Suttonella ornithocola]|uniref:Dihydrolipoyl dehydrogenase n=1 Tax=Suttonella ornithocola TaxID=279832 RepID=A0A380MRW5_9GAMM|nr:dihydrolipoyl dehydrogenase [Suttonella ornithocola]SUO95340.1 Dihydrolipoyl dehydrogenase [Suttonella ornithocola]